VLRVTFLDVGQGDGAVIETPSGRVIVIDGGGAPGTDEREGRDPGSRIVVPFLRARGISSVDLLVLTHPDDDHVQGLVSVVQRLRVMAALDSGFPSDPETPCTRLRSLLSARRIPVSRAQRNDKIDIGEGAHLEILHPGKNYLKNTHSDTNNNALVLRLIYKNTKILFTADLEDQGEKELLSSGQNISADVLKIGHHGSRGSSSEKFLRQVSPKIGVISCGRENRFGHPHKETLRRLEGIRLYRTDIQGAITLESDGQSVTMTPFLKRF
jgi:competence protein ComEC